MAFTEEEIREFKTEAAELLDNAEKSLLALDKGGDFGAHYDAIFRTFHSIKGAAGMMEMTRLQQHMHQLENIFTEQKGKKTLSKSYTDFFLTGTDAARNILDGNDVEFNYQVESSKAIQTPQLEPSNKSLTVERSTNNAGKVIVIDDEPMIVKLLTDILSEAGLEVIGTSKPTEVISLIETNQPDVVVTDILMPELDGMGVLAAVADKHPDLPVIFVSGHVSKSALIEAIDNGVYAVIEKPFGVPQVISCCLNAVRKHQLTRLLNSSINLIMYQFSDLDDFLKAQGKEDVRKVIDREINTLIEQRRLVREASKKKRVASI